METEQKIPRATMRRVYSSDGVGEARLLDTYRAVVNEEDDARVYGMVTDEYKVLQHEDFLDCMERAISYNPDYGKFERTLVFPKGGEIMEVKYRFPDITVPIDGRHGKDTVNPMVIGKNGYNGKVKVHMMMGAFQTFCWNGLVIGKKYMQSKNLHIQSLNMDRVTENLRIAMDSFSDQTEIWKSWVDKVTTYEQYTDVMETINLSQSDNKAIVAEINKYEEIINPETLQQEVAAKVLTLWAFYSILTQHATHKVKNPIKRMDLDLRISDAFARY
jgi:hypothetical protein